MNQQSNSIDQAKRERVMDMSQFGLPAHQIANALGITAEELQQQFSSELVSTAPKTNLEVLKTLHEMATSGRSTSASIFWARTRCDFVPATAPRVVIARSPKPAAEAAEEVEAPGDIPVHINDGEPNAY